MVAQIQKVKSIIMKCKFCKVSFGFSTAMWQKYNLYYLLSKNLIDFGMHIFSSVKSSCSARGAFYYLHIILYKYKKNVFCLWKNCCHVTLMTLRIQNNIKNKTFSERYSLNGTIASVASYVFPMLVILFLQKFQFIPNHSKDFSAASTW